MGRKTAQTYNDICTLSLKDAFNEIAARSVKDYPEQLGTFYLTSTTAPFYVSPAAAQLLTKNAAVAKAYIKQNIKYARDNSFSALAGPIPAGKQFINAIIMNIDEISARKESQMYVSAKFPAKMDIISILDHEIGHYAVEEGLSPHVSAHVRECAADAFMALRHIQRFGEKTDLLEHGPFTRARTIVHGTSPNHYTGIILQKIESLKWEKDLSALPPYDTALLAGKIARDYSLSDARIAKIAKAFHPLGAHIMKNKISYAKTFNIRPKNNIGYFRTLLGIMRDNRDDHDVYRAAKLIMSKHTKEIKREAARKKPFWQEALAFMEKHEKESGIILNGADAMDAARKPPASAAPLPSIRR